jgi:hypothetical protein
MELAKFNKDEFEAELAAQFPTARLGLLWHLSPAAVADLEAALAGGSEEKIQRVLTANPYLIQYALERSGHHGVWVFPKAMIRPPGADRSKGLIPDYLVASRSSLGYCWHVVELKRADVLFSNKAGDGLSPDGNRAIVQCNRYLQHFSDYIDTVRANVCVPEVIQPYGAVLVIGRAADETEAQTQCRADFDRSSPKIAVVSYDRILHGARSDLAVRA